MTLTQEDLQIASEELGAAVGGSGGAEGDATAPGRLAEFLEFVKRSRFTLLGLVFLIGLSLGWLIIGWWIWPVKWTNSDPWLLRMEHRTMFVRLVAEKYWHDGDISYAREALAGWDRDDLADLLATMQVQASSPEERQHLAALAEALALSDSEHDSLVAALLGQKILIWSVILAASPLAVAVALAVSPLVRNRTEESTGRLGYGAEAFEQELEELLALDEEQLAEGGGEEWEEEEEEWVGEREEEEEQEEEEGEEADEDEWLDEEIGEEGQLVGDILLDVFQEEDEALAYYEALCEGLEDVDVDDLVHKAQGVLDQLVRSNALRE
jgi:hypothetical protein